MALTRPRAAQIYDIDYKQATRVVTVSNINLSGGAPSQVDGVNLSLKDRVLVTGQSTPSQNGIYYVTTLGSGSNGTWSRSLDTDVTGELLSGTIVMVTEGLIYADTQWKITTNDPITVGVTEQTWVQNYSANSIASGNSNVVVLTNANVLLSSAGTANVVDVFGTGIKITGTESVTGNATVGNLLTAGQVSAAGNVTGDYILGNVFYANGITASKIYNGTSEVNVTSSGGNVNVTVGGTSNVAVFSTAGEYITGLLSVTGNTTSGNLLTGGLVSATGNATAGNVLTGGLVSATGSITSSANITGGNLLTGGLISSTGNVTAGNINTGGLISATGNINGGNLISSALVQGTTVSASGNAIAGNVTTAGLVTATGNVTGGNINTGGLISATGSVYSGNIYTSGGLSLTGNSITASGATIIIDPNGSGGIDGNVVIAGNLSVQGNITYVDSNVITTNEKSITLANNATTGTQADGSGIDVGNTTIAYWRFNNATTSWQSNIGITPASNAALDLGGTSNYWNVVYATTSTLTGNITAGNLLTGGLVSAAGNVSGGNVNTAGLVTATGNVTGGNINTAGLITASGNILGGNVSTAGNVTASYFLGNVACASGIYATKIFNGTSEANIGTANGNANISINGTSNVVVISSTGEYVTGLLSVTGNTTSGNLLTGGLISATSNITGGNLLTGGLLSVTGNVTGGNILTVGQVSATGNVTGSYLFGNASQVSGVNAFSTVIVATQSNITANTISSALTFEAGNSIALSTSPGTNTLTIAYVGAGGSSIFATGGDMGLITEAVTSSEDLGLVTDSVTVSYDLGTLGVVGVVSNSDIIKYTITGDRLANDIAISTTANLTAANVTISSSNQDVRDWYYVSGNTVSIASQTTAARDVLFNTTGLKMYILDTSIYQYTLSTANSVSTASYDSISFSFGSQDSSPQSAVMDASNTGLYMLGGTNKTVYQYTLSTSNIGTLAYASKSFSVNSQETAPTGLAFRDDLSTMYIVGTTNKTIYQYGLTSPGNVATAVYTASPPGALSVSAYESNPTGLAFTSDGTKCYVTGSGSDAVHQFTLSSAWDITSGTYTGSYYIGSQEGNVAGLFYNTTARTAYSLGTDKNAVFQYTTGNGTIYVGNSAYFTSTVQTSGNIYSLGNIGGGNVITPGLISAVGNVTTGGLISATGNITTAGIVSATGNITTAGIVSATGNITAGNILTVGIVSATGNVTGNYFVGNGAALTGISTSIPAGLNINLQQNYGGF